MSEISTIQSREFILTKEEAAYFASKTDEDMKQYYHILEQKRMQRLENWPPGERVQFYDEHPVHPHISPYTVGLRAFANIISTFVVDKKCRILDIAAGSGFLGIQMKKVGFENIDGLEPVEDMIKNQPEGVYGKIYRELISKESPTSIPTGSYDCVVIGGSVNSCNIQADALPEIIRVVKPGGVITFNIGDFWYRFKQFGHALETKLQQCLETGVLETVIKQRTIHHYRCEDTTVYILKKSSNKIISEP
ncbi:uncharacterized protein [Amphiura filiformis]|uniref:uncharacterized protein n=1 Tax=Amphiura filiformis TaxID=82378 RepID=UPI003B21C2BD